ncbi:unnamed protein product [Clonostachys solani]|uniref:Peptidase M43 pregnancy-associated plasma-A domain-containing protein n=1 Tax=Clonostachys solani TaxID=160281 RepID=A0A9N9Z9R8_9HYPO|nr:unnamed protein product [Clonostachys solani]
MALKQVSLVSTMVIGALARCGAELSPELKANYEIPTRTASIASADPIEVNTYIQVITNGSTIDDGYLTSEQLDKQKAVMNDVFADHSIQFNFLDTTYTENEDWAHGIMMQDMSIALRKGSYKDLNIFFLQSMGGQVTGQCSFPLNLTDFPDPGRMKSLDGCMVVSSTIPGGSHPTYNGGLTAVHEVGHWFGLIHVFTDTCGGNRDEVDDTPEQATATYGCPTGKDSCPEFPGVDSIHNYSEFISDGVTLSPKACLLMILEVDYSDDYCKTEFTPGQVSRMHNAWATYREPVDA